MTDLSLPPELQYASTTIPVMMAMRRFAHDTLAAWRSDPHLTRFIDNRTTALAASPELNHLFGLEWRDDMCLHLLLPKDGGGRVYDYTLPNLLHEKASESLGMQRDYMAYRLAINFLLLTMDHSKPGVPAYIERVIEAGLHLGVNKAEFEIQKSPVFIQAERYQDMLETGARLKHMLLKGWSLNLNLIERRALSTRSFSDGIRDDDREINATLQRIDTRPHDDPGSSKLQQRHVLSGDHLDQHIEFYFCAKRAGGDIGGVGNIFSLMDENIQVHRQAPESMISLMPGTLLEEVIGHPLFMGSGLRITEAKASPIKDSFFLTTDIAKTKREVPIDNANALKIWGQDFEEY